MFGLSAATTPVVEKVGLVVSVEVAFCTVSASSAWASSTFCTALALLSDLRLS